MRFVLTPVFGALVKFVMVVFVGALCATCCVAFACDDSWHAATMMAALLVVCGLALFGLGQIWFAATLLTLMGYEALFVRGLALAREEVVDVTGDVSEVDGALCEIVYEAASFGAAALGVWLGALCCLARQWVWIWCLLQVFSCLILKGNSSRACVCLSADRVCSPCR